MTQALTQEAAAEWLEVEERRQVGSGRQRHSKRGNGEGAPIGLASLRAAQAEWPSGPVRG